jgi:inosine/xanthosine triphosphate pyrophosphatase family protein
MADMHAYSISALGKAVIADGSTLKSNSVSGVPGVWAVRGVRTALAKVSQGQL